MTGIHGDHCSQSFADNPNVMMLVAKEAGIHMAFCRHETACGIEIPVNKQVDPTKTDYGSLLPVNCIKCGLLAFYDIANAVNEISSATLMHAIKNKSRDSIPPEDLYEAIVFATLRHGYVGRAEGQSWDEIYENLDSLNSGAIIKLLGAEKQSATIRVMAKACFESMEKSERFNPKRVIIP